MLENVVSDFVDGFPNERAIDGPLETLLRAEGFYDVAFVHGTSELGRDFIAKRKDAGTVRQYNFQSKHGDLGAGSFRDVRQQLEDVRTTHLAHPSYDAELSGVIVLVTNGRLKGDARAQADGYGKTLPPPWTFEVWSRSTLVELLERHLHAALVGHARGSLLAILGSIDEAKVHQRELERHTRTWVPTAGERVTAKAALEAHLIARRLADSERLDLACYCLLALVRAHRAGDARDEQAKLIEGASRAFAGFADELWARCTPDYLSAEALIDSDPGFGMWITYPVRCLVLVETLSLLALWRRFELHEPDPALEEWITSFVALQPGVAHPPSDRYAISLVAPAILLGARRQSPQTWLQNVAAWVADRYEGEGLGLASWSDTPDTEVAYLLGDLEYTDLPKRRESFVASIVLDLASLLEVGTLFDDVRNDFLAVELVPVVREFPEGRDAWISDTPALRQELNAPYDDRFDETDGWQTAPHHRREIDPIARADLWSTLAGWSVVRDRFSPALARQMVVAAQVEAERARLG